MIKLPSDDALEFSRVVKPWIDRTKYRKSGGQIIHFKPNVPKEVLDAYDRLVYTKPQYFNEIRKGY